MDQDQQQEHKQHVCRFCNKSFSNGKILGGHMRCHVAKNPKKLAKKRAAESLSSNSKSKSYGLRVNPKKSSRVWVASSDQETWSSMEIPCRVCGKAFDSMRALFGHMRHHSSKRKKEPSSCSDGREEEEEEGPPIFVESSGFAKRKRSRRSRYKFSSTTTTASPTTNCSFSVSNSSLEFDPDVEEIAVCLLMLSKGIRKLDEFLDADSDSPKTVIVDKSRVVVDENCLSFLDDKKLSRFSENDGDEKENGEGMEVSDLGPDRQDFWSETILENPNRKIEYKCRICDKSFHSHQALGGHQTVHRPNKTCNASQFDDFPITEAKFGCDEDSIEAEKVIAVITVSETSKEHKCPICFKVFASGQALGGHKRAHMVKDSSSEVSHENCGISGHLLDDSTDIAELESPWWIRNNLKHEFLVGLVPN